MPCGPPWLLRRSGSRRIACSWRSTRPAAIRPRRCAPSKTCGGCCATSSARLPARSSLRAPSAPAAARSPPRRAPPGAGGGGPPGGPPAGRGAPRAPLPSTLAAATSRHPFVGRDGDLAILHEAWHGALGDDRRLVLLAGDAGIGKSRLAAEFPRAVHDEGAVVLYGRFDETGPGAYQPVLEMLRGWSGGAPLTGPAQRLGPRAAALAGLLPELGAAAGPGTLRRDAGAARRRLFDALAALLTELAGGAPMLLVFDDLHWADSPTVQLLRHLVRAPHPQPTMFVGPYRDAELDERHPLPDLIAALRRDGVLTHVALDGLGPGEVGA